MCMVVQGTDACVLVVVVVGLVVVVVEIVQVALLVVVLVAVVVVMTVGFLGGSVPSTSLHAISQWLHLPHTHVQVHRMSYRDRTP